MNAEQVIPLPGYQQYWGSKLAFIGELAGQLSYTTGGQQFDASALGLGGFDSFEVVGRSYSGTYRCEVQYLAVDAAPSAPKGAVASVKIIWIVVATGAEVANAVDLSGEIIRFQAVGV